ncbi:MAG: sulfite exporter TauE/SafE family protein, partial [Rhodospirillales bacterium]
AIAAAMFGYLFTGAVGTVLFARHGSIRWRAAIWLCLGAVPFAFAGAWASNVFPAGGLEAAIAALVAFAGWQALRRKESDAGSLPDPAALAGIASGVGFISAVTGTGGPVTLVPVLLWLDVPVLAAIGLSQTIMVPIAAAASWGNILYGSLDFILGAVIAAGLAAGAVAGGLFAHTLTTERLRQFLAVAMIVIGALLIGRLGLKLFGAPGV